MYAISLDIAHVGFAIFGVIEGVRSVWLDAKAASAGEKSGIFEVVGVVGGVREPAIAAWLSFGVAEIDVGGVIKDVKVEKVA